MFRETRVQSTKRILTLFDMVDVSNVVTTREYTIQAGC